MSYERIIKRARRVGNLIYTDEVVGRARSCQYETRRSGGRTWAAIQLAREFHESAEFNWMDEYKILYNESDLRFVGHLMGITRSASGGEVSLLLLSPVLYLERIRPVFPTSPTLFATHPSEADIAYWVKALLDEWVTPDGNLSYNSEDIQNTGITVEMPILDGRYSIPEILDAWALMAGSRCWGVDLEKKIYFKANKEQIEARFHVGQDRGWGKIISLNDQISLGEVVNSLEVVGEVTATLDGNGAPVYSSGDPVFGKKFTYEQSISTYGSRHLSIQVPTVRTDAQAAAVANACFSQLKEPWHRLELNVSNVSAGLDPLEGLFVVYDEVGNRLGEFPADRVTHVLAEDALATIQLPVWPRSPVYSLLPASSEKTEMTLLCRELVRRGVSA